MSSNNKNGGPPPPYGFAPTAPPTYAQSVYGQTVGGVPPASPFTPAEACKCCYYIILLFIINCVKQLIF